MSVRYAVLWDLDDGPDAIPCGLVVDRGDYVQVRLPGDGWGIRERWDHPLEGEMEPDCTRKVYNPGDPLYFDSILNSLFRTFAVTLGPEVANV